MSDVQESPGSTTAITPRPVTTSTPPLATSRHFLEYVEREMPAEERDAELIAGVKGYPQEAGELAQVEERLTRLV